MSLLTYVDPVIVGIDIENAPRWGFSDGYVWDQMTCVSAKLVGDEPLVFDPSKAQWDPELLIVTEPEAVAEVATILVDWRLPDETLRQLLSPLWEIIEKADAVLGHNFGHDWKHLVSTAAELHQGPLPERRVIDTQKAVPSGPFRDLDSFCYRYSLGFKPHLSNQAWADAHQRGSEKAQRLVRYRNAIDVVLTERLYWKQKELGWL